ncbi:MAG TPA: ABC-F type ribosomal protection protein [Candidatus Merdisoma merdipullorum]|nr:ABC-F type ribosomal protection protein [Candidatus Merdisoma merdipullorum]
MSLISVNDLTFYYEGSSDNIFENVSFQIDTNWKLGFVARNGRGKTTFLKLLMGEYEYRGRIASEECFDYFPFEIRDMERNFLEIVEELYPDYEFWKLCRELTLLHVDADVLYRPFSTLSNGERTKVMLAVLFSRENNFLLIDEPTNHLDQEGRRSVCEYLKGKKGFILVSHDREFLDQCVDHVLVINRTNIEVYKGNFSVWWEQKQRRDAWEQAENEKLKQDIKRLESSARIKEQWADDLEARKIGKKAAEEYRSKGISPKGRRPLIGEKSRKMQRRRKNLEHRQERALEEKEGLLKNLETTEELKLFPQRHYKETLVSLSEVRVYYEQPDGGKKELPMADFRINNGDCVVLKGKNGCGKSSVLKAVLQAAGCQGTEDWGLRWEGSIETASGLRISYVPQDTGHLKGSLTEYADAYGLELSLFLALLRKLDFTREQFEKPIEDFSGGQKKKVLIARSLCEQAHLYIWDEPLNFIDVFSRMQIEELLVKYRPTMLLVEHDKAFTDRLGTKIVELG